MGLPPKSPDPGNVQGIVFSGFSSFPSCHLLFQFSATDTDVSGFIGELFPYVQSAERWSKRPGHFLNIGFTFSGLQATSVPLVEFNIFPVEFRMGPTSYYSQQNLCDLGSSHPDHWAFGNAKNRVDCVVHCYGNDPEKLNALIDRVSEAANAHQVVEILPLEEENKPNETGLLSAGMDQLSNDSSRGRYFGNSAGMGKKVHFGYRDGISGPDLNWPQDWPEEDGFTDPGALNNFLVGYPNSRFLPGPSACEGPSTNAAKFAKDGCYNAFRVMYQDVEAFDHFLDKNAAEIAPAMGKPICYVREWLAAKLNGRWRNGSPLVMSPEGEDDATRDATRFNFSGDKSGARCPFSSHTRVTNPRDQELFRAERPVPEFARRGAPYGKPVKDGNYAGERGLIGLFLCGNLGEQFEKVYSWVNGNTFSPVFPERTQDALIANRLAPLATLSLPIPLENGGSVTLDLNPEKINTQFVVTRGTLYCFLPSLPALDMIANTRL